jgi:hypothetical protein
VNQRVGVVVAVIVAVAVGIGLGALLFGGDDSGDGDTAAGSGTTVAGNPAAGGSSTTAVSTPAGGTLPELPATTVPEEGLTGDALELALAINRAHQLTYHILLRSPDPEFPQDAELWRRLPEARRDVRLASGTSSLETREFRSPERGHIACLIDTSGTGQTTCLQAPPGELDPADPVLGAVDPAAGVVTASDSTLGGRPIRCFTVEMGDGLNHVACFDGDGIPAVIDGGDGRLERVGDPERGVADDVFVVPDASFIPSDGVTTTTTNP